MARPKVRGRPPGPSRGAHAHTCLATPLPPTELQPHTCTRAPSADQSQSWHQAGAFRLACSPQRRVPTPGALAGPLPAAETPRSSFQPQLPLHETRPPRSCGLRTEHRTRSRWTADSHPFIAGLEAAIFWADGEGAEVTRQGRGSGEGHGRVNPPPGEGQCRWKIEDRGRIREAHA